MSFPSFSALPLELQDLIWETYLRTPPISPIHLAVIQDSGRHRPDPDHVPLDLGLYLDPSCKTQVYLSESAMLATLLSTTRGSRAVALRYQDSLQRNAKGKAARHPFEPAAPRQCQLVQGNERKPVDVIRDTVAVRDGWYRRVQLLTQGASTDCIHYLALTWGLGWCDVSGLKQLRQTIIPEFMRGVQVLYILVDQATLHSFEAPWPEDWHLPTADHGIVPLAEYLTLYGPPGTSPPPIRCARLRAEIYEVPATQIAKLGGLGRTLMMLEEERAKWKPSPRWGRIMSWRRI
jgi:hypothetical protein